MKDRESTGLVIRYSIQDSRFGKVLTASTEKGICCVSFLENAENELNRRFPGAALVQSDIHREIQELINGWPKTAGQAANVPLHLMGTDFQLSVWKALLTIPAGELATYKEIALKAGRPTAIRATGTAIGQNPIALLIPCHRVITSSGTLGGYRWGTEMKRKLIELEKKKS
jgi:AraC family transcriptional regulator of adaptative response/methylated-DNA-[protein]-cysteine methyltransferase